jgi:hypothetical protein
VFIVLSETLRAPSASFNEVATVLHVQVYRRRMDEKNRGWSTTAINRMANNLKVTAAGVEAEARMSFLRTTLPASPWGVVARSDKNLPGWGLNQPYR